MNKTIFSLLCLVAIGLPAVAGTLPGYYPDHFQTIGKLNRLDRDNKVIVINDNALNLAAQVKVYTRNSRFGTLSQLDIGMRIAVQVRGNQAVVTEIWVLPKHFKPKKRRIHILK